MRPTKRTASAWAISCALVVGCSSSEQAPPLIEVNPDSAMNLDASVESPVDAAADLAVSNDAAAPDDFAIRAPDLARGPDLSLPSAASQLAPTATFVGGQNVLDVSTDEGGGVWAVTPASVYYYPSGKTNPFTYSQAQGLARGWATWVDTYYSGPDPVTYPVTFTAVGGATAGQAIIGNEGAIADRLIVDSATGNVLQVNNMSVQPDNSSPAEYPAHLVRVVATHSIVVDLHGTLNGTAYIGGWHGFTAFHGLTADCGCLAFEEHQHYIPGPPAQPNYCDDTQGDTSCWDGDVWGIALSPKGDVWAGDRHFIQLLPQRSLGANAGLFDPGALFATGIDVWSGVKDEVHGLAVDAAGGLWVASGTNGLAYFDPTLANRTLFTTSNGLPSNELRGVAVDGRGDVWIGTASNGVARYRPATATWVYYTSASGLGSDNVNNVYFDKYGAGNRLLFATGSGVVAYSGE